MPADVETMAYNDERGEPWHGLGTRVHGLMTTEECIGAAGLDWTVEKVPLWYLQHGQLVQIRDKVAGVRSTDGKYIATVGVGYQHVQNRDAFTFADALVAENPDKAIFDTAGSLNGGRIVFLSMDLSAVAPIRLPGEDEFKTFLLLANYHDGHGSGSALVTPVRVVCRNTLNAAIGGATAMFRIRHSGDIAAKLAEARRAIGLTIDYVARFEQVAEAAMQVKVTDKAAEKVLQQVFPMTPGILQKPDGPLYQKHAATRAFELYQTAPDIGPFRGTAWGLVNAVAEFVDHERTYGKAKGREALDVRMTSILWGSGKEAVDDTLRLAAPQLVRVR